MVKNERQKQENQGSVAKDNESYTMALVCSIFPLLDHSNVAISQESLNVSSSADSGYGASFSSTKLNNQTLRVTPAVMKNLGKKIKEWIKENNDPKRKGKLDSILNGAFLSFYHDVIKKQGENIVAVGSSYEEFVQLFVNVVDSELKSNILPDKSNLNEIIFPFSSTLEAVTSRNQTFVGMLKESIEDIAKEEQELKKNRKINSEKGSHHRSKSQKSHTRTVSHNSNNSLLNRIKSWHDDGEENFKIEISKESTFMCEWIKEAFIFTRSKHEREIQSIASLPQHKILKEEINLRLKALESGTEILSLYGIKENMFKSLNENAMKFWIDLERKNLNRILRQIDQIYANPEEEVNTEQTVSSPTEENIPKKKKWFSSNKSPDTVITNLKVHLVKAKNLLNKDTGPDGVSDPYCILDYDSEQRFESKVIENNLNPEWNQDMTFKVNSKSNKPITITVWDKTLEGEEKINESIFKAKYWKEEADDFLGMYVIDVQNVIEELKTNKSICGW